MFPFKNRVRSQIKRKTEGFKVHQKSHTEKPIISPIPSM